MKIRVTILAVFALFIMAFAYKAPLLGVDVTSMDKKANPRDDFFEYANGNWIRKNPIPAAEARWGNFIILVEQNNEMLKKILEDAASDVTAPAGSVRQKVGDFWRIAMDTVKLEREGTRPLQADLAAIDALKGNTEITALLALMQRKGLGGIFEMSVGQDIKNNEKNITWLGQDGLGLPDRDYYLKDDAKSKMIREAYVKHIAKMYQLHGVPADKAAEMASRVFAFETGLAQVSTSRTENRDTEKRYNKYTVSSLKTQFPNINWSEYFRITGLARTNPDTVIIAHPSFFEHVNRELAEASLETWKNFLKWKAISATAAYMNDALNIETFSFYGTVIQGIQERKPRWRSIVAAANGHIGQLVGQEYVKVAFSESSKARMNEMVDNLRAAFRKRIENLEWMSPETKHKALEKLQSFNRKLGYPDKWDDYSALEIKRDSYLANYFRSSEFAFDKMVDDLGKPIDKDRWEMLPQTVNAYYNPVMNEIVFPAGIIQPPFFDPKADDAVNYGAIGAVIGHEFSHGFDDQGSKYDAKGNMVSWWTEDDRRKFDDRTKLLVNQFNQFKVADNVYVNGELTLGENIADLAGLTVAYDAYQMSLAGKKREKIDGLTPEQRFFVGFAQVWRGHARPEYIQNQVMVDPHSPQQFRVLGPLSNMPEFYNAFNVKKGDKMWREESERARIW